MRRVRYLEAALSGGSLSVAAVFAFVLLGLSFTRCHAAFDNGMEARRGRCNFHVDVHPGRAAALAALDETRWFMPSMFCQRGMTIGGSSHLKNGSGRDITCSICLQDVPHESHEYMVAPCNHIFHAECLNRWMETKLECPLCRTSLP